MTSLPRSATVRLQPCAFRFHSARPSLMSDALHDAFVRRHLLLSVDEVPREGYQQRTVLDLKNDRSEVN